MLDLSVIVRAAVLFAVIGGLTGCASGGHAEHVRTDPGYGGELRLEYGVLSKRAAYVEAERLMVANCGGRGHRITSEDTVRAIRPGAEKRAEQAMRFGDPVAYQDATRLEYRVCYDCLPYQNEIGSPQDPKSNVSVLSSIRNGARINADEIAPETDETLSDRPETDSPQEDEVLDDDLNSPRDAPRLAPGNAPRLAPKLAPVNEADDASYEAVEAVTGKWVPANNGNRRGLRQKPPRN